MDRREALRKATIDRTVAAGGLLPAGVARQFIQVIKDADTFSAAIGQDVVGTAAGTINKITSGSRLIRAAAENADDGYRAGVTFPTVPYAAVKIRLPWEVTEDVYHENIEGEALEAKIVDEMTKQFSLDLSDLDVNGDTGSGDPFVAIDNGLLKLASTASGIHRVNGGAINSGALAKEHFFATQLALPNKYRKTGQAKLFMSPNRKVSWIEYLSARSTPGGDAILAGDSLANKPLGMEVVEVPQFPDDRVIYTPPDNLRRVITWDVRKRKVTGDTDWELATRDKRGYLYFMKRDFIIREADAVVDLYGLSAPS